MFDTKYKPKAGMILALCAAALALPCAAYAGPTYTFTTSVGTQPSDVGVITLTQKDANTVDVLVDLKDTSLPLPRYGFLNTGGPHTPFAFNLSGTEAGITYAFIQPNNGTYSFGVFSLSTSNGDNTPYGTYGVTINSTAGNGSSNAYYGDLEFTVTRSGGLSTDAFVKNSDGYYFSADLTDGGSNTGAQAWGVRTTSGSDPATVPEPGSLLLMSAGLGAIATVRARRRNASAV